MYNFDDFFLLKSLNEQQRSTILASLSKPTLFKKGEVIYSEKHFPNAIGLLTEGEAFAVTNNGNKLFMKNFCVGTCFGAAAIFGNNGEFVSTITAKTNIKILFIKEDELKDLFHKFPQTAINYIDFLSDKIRFLNKKVGLLSSGSVEDTLLNYLTSIANSDNEAVLPSNMTQLSKSLGISRASLYRCLESLEKNGFILKNNILVKVIKNEKNH